MIKYNDTLYQGNHTPLVSKKVFDSVQDVLSGKHHAKAQKLLFPLRGYMQCAACGCLLTASFKKSKYIYYYCTNGKGRCNEHYQYLKEKEADELVATIFGEIKFDEEMVEITYLAAKEKSKNFGLSINSQKAQLVKQLKTAQEKLLNLSEAIATNPTLTD